MAFGAVVAVEDEQCKVDVVVARRNADSAWKLCVARVVMVVLSVVVVVVLLCMNAVVAFVCVLVWWQVSCWGVAVVEWLVLETEW